MCTSLPDQRLVFVILTNVDGQRPTLFDPTAGGAWPVSPVFGRISGRSWGVMLYRHLDYHLGQFGV